MTARRRHEVLLRSAFEAGAQGEDFEAWLARHRGHQPLEVLDLPVRLENALLRRGVATVGGAREWLERGAHPRYPGDVAAYDLRGIGFANVQAGQAALSWFDSDESRKGLGHEGS